jgi:predicted helicase
MLDKRDALKNIRTFPQLIKFLRDELDWPIESEDFEELTFDYTPEELGIDTANAAKIQGIKRLRPLTADQPWGIFFVKFEPKKLPVVALRRVLSRVVLKKRASANRDDRAAWQADDLLFISNYGEGNERQISFAHFSQHEEKADLPTLKVLGWDNRDTPLHLDDIADKLTTKLAWPENDKDAQRWRETWRSAFTLRHLEVITTSKDLAVRLADLARAIRARIQTVLTIETENGPVTKLMKAFRQALIHDLSRDDFADMYAQTIAYGLLSARVTHPTHDTADAVAAHIPVTNPFLKELMETFLHLGGRKRKGRGGEGIDFDELGVSEVVELLDTANMEAVVRDFGDRNRDEDPVIHFYELFLKEYDAKKRMQRGVFYTPQPVVSYIVRSIHELLQTDFGLEDGLASTATWGDMTAKHTNLKIPAGTKPADPFVVILDPATGTATFLVEVIDVIQRTLTAKWKKQLLTGAQQRAAWNDYVPKHLLPRLFGYELMMAPYAIAHMKIGLKLYETGYRFDSDERARIYLTNALEPASDSKEQHEFEQWVPALAHEAHAVNAIKRHQRFTVVTGNPPYARHSSNPSKDSKGQLTFIGRLVEDYKEGCPELRKPAQAKYLQDDYIKFLRFSEHLIVEAGAGTMGLITNHGFLDNPTFRGVRNHLLSRFSSVHVLDLHGNTNKKERSPDGSEDKNIFDIKQGVAIFVSCRVAADGHRIVRHGDLWGTRERKYQLLADSTRQFLVKTPLEPKPPQYLLCPQDEANEEEYAKFSSVREIFFPNGDPAPGIVTTHDSFAVAFTREQIISNVEALLRTKDEDEARQLFRLCTQSQWSYLRAKRELADGKWRKKVIPLYYRPFDTRYTVYDSNVAVHRRERVTRHLVGGGNLALLTSRMTKGETFKHVQVTRLVPEVICMSPKTSNNGFVFPLWLRADIAEGRQGLFGDGARLNLGREFLEKLCITLGVKPCGSFGMPQGITPEDIFNYTFAVLHCPGYRSRYMEFLKRDFPRLPLTGDSELFHGLARRGGELVALHLMESPKLDLPLTTYTGPANPEVEKISYALDTVWIDKAQTRGFRGVPEDIWRFHVGGYQVCEKWLKDRKGRTLSKDDIAYYQKVLVALKETIRLMKEIDEIIEKHGGWPGAFQSAKTDSQVPRHLDGNKVSVT